MQLGFSNKKYLICLISIQCLSSFAQSSASSSDEALKEVMKLLTDPNQRQKVVAQDKRAQEADQLLQSVGKEYSEEIYQLAATIFQSVFSQSGGNADKMDEILLNAKKDPAGFLKSLPAEQLKAVKELAVKIQSSKKP